jgi:hypothetical protein
MTLNLSENMDYSLWSRDRSDELNASRFALFDIFRGAHENVMLSS